MTKQRNFFGKVGRDYQIEQSLKEINTKYENLDEQQRDDIEWALYQSLRKSSPQAFDRYRASEKVIELAERIERNHYLIKKEEKTPGDILLSILENGE